jgi:riboflavin kinase / FMN adenylyltransferase
MIGSLGQGRVVTIGVYDGVHLGHRALIAEALRVGGEMGLPVVVLTFDRHPAELVSPERAPCLLTDLEQKVELLGATGVDSVAVLAFDEERRNESAEEFVEEVLVNWLDARAVVVGKDFHFGHARSGNVGVLRRLDRFAVHGVELVSEGDGDAPPVSSTRIRSLLGEGQVEEAAALLGRDHEIRGVVIRGDGRARELGAPTANIEMPERTCLPAEGIYAGWYRLQSGGSYPCAISLGRRPTFYGPEGALVLEAHLLDWSGDLYGQPARLCFSRRLRGQETYDDAETLARQMAADLDDARRALSR